MMRECLGCDGTGSLLVCQNCGTRSDRDTVAAFGLCAPCCDLESDGDEMAEGSPSVPCQVCLGTGRIEDVVSVQDSLADAETLMQITQSAHGVESVMKYGDGPALFAAAAYGADLAWHMRSGVLPWKRRSTLLRPFRAAFRAVPGLRE